MSADSHTRLARALLVAAVVCLGAVLARNLGVTSPVLTTAWDDVYYLTEALAIAVCGLRVLSCTGAERAAWAVLTVGLTAYFLGDLYYELVLPADSPPYPSPADAGYLCIYPAAYVALVLLLRARTDGVSPLLWLDGIIGGLAAAAVGAALVLGVVASTEGPLATVITNLAYPLGDLIMLAFVIVVMTVTGRRGGSLWAVLALAFAVWGVADSLYLYQSASGTYQEYTLLDTGWPATYVLIAIAAWRPVQRLDARRLRASMLALPALMTSVALALLLVDHYVRLNQAAIWLASASIATAVVRFGLVFRQNLQLLGRQRAGGRDRRAHRSRQPPGAAARPRPRGRRCHRGGPRGAGALRPRRLQDLQRHLRPPRRRRAARAAGPHPLRDDRRPGQRLPDGRRRVLPALQRPLRGPRGAGRDRGVRPAGVG